MDVFRVEENAWGQETLIGVSWELLWLFAGVGLAFIVGHMIYMRVRAARARPGARVRPGAGARSGV